MSALLPEGFRDGLPPYADASSALEMRMLEAARLHGYERADPPMVEFAEQLDTRLKTGALEHAVRFVDPVSQRTLAVRPDITAQIARIAASGMGHHPRPVRLSYAGAVVKLRAGELLPDRQSRQMGCELVGKDTVSAVQEVVTVAIDALDAAGVEEISIDFTLPNIIEALVAHSTGISGRAVLELKDALDAKDAGGVAAIAPEFLPLIVSAGPMVQAIARLRRYDTKGVLSSRLDGLEMIANSLGDRVVLTLDPTERHGFEFQSWLGFSVFSAGATQEIGRGGTYSIVCEDGSEEAATGFSLFADRFAVRSRSTERRRLFLPFGTTSDVGVRLRKEGWVTVAALDAVDTPEYQLATHVWVAGEARAL